MIEAFDARKNDTKNLTHNAMIAKNKYQNRSHNSSQNQNDSRIKDMQRKIRNTSVYAHQRENPVNTQLLQPEWIITAKSGVQKIISSQRCINGNRRKRYSLFYHECFRKQKYDSSEKRVACTRFKDESTLSRKNHGK